MISEAIQKVVDKGNLTYEEAYGVMNEIMDGETSQVQNAAYLAALSTKNTDSETIEEISGSAAAMLEHAPRMEYREPVFEIVGTGGDHAGTINISTAAAFIIAAGGVKVAKHGNRAASSKSGAADCLEALGINIDQPPEKCRQLLDEVGMCFLFAQKYHTSMRYVGQIRRELGIRTIFNLLGPLTNPAYPSTILLGVYDESLLVTMAQTLGHMGVKRGMAVYGRDGMDEMSVSGETAICEFRDGWYRSYTLEPESCGFTRCTKNDVSGGTPEQNAKDTLAILSGEEGPKSDVVLLNAGGGLYLADKAESIPAGVELARQIVLEGKALDLLNRFRELSNS